MPAFLLALLKPISKMLIAAFAREGVQIGPATAPEFIMGSLGFWTAKLARDFSTPLVIVHGQEHANSLPPHMHLRRVIERINKVLGVDEWTAQRLASVTLEVVRGSGLQVNALQVLFDPTYAHSRERIFKAMFDPDFPPTQASVAICIGKLPPLPATSLAERLKWIGPAMKMNGGAVVESVTERPTFLWNEPSREISQTHPALIDNVNMRGGKPHDAELGLGFCLVQQTRDLRGEVDYVIFAPIVGYRDQDKRGWHPSGILRSNLREEFRVRQGKRPLLDIIGKPLSLLPRLKVCAACLAIHSDDRDDLHHACERVAVNAQQVLMSLRTFSHSGKTIFTAEELAAKVQFDDQGVNEGVTADAVEILLRTHGYSLGVWSMQGQWRLARQSKLQLATDVTV